MWAHVDNAAPIIAITNGVHRGTWQDPRVAAAADAGAETLRQARRQMKDELLAEVATRTGVRLDSEALTIGFARRAATYKRPDLLLRSPERLAPLLKERRIQLVFSGKAHPADQAGKAVVALLVETIRQWPESIVFLEDYDMALGRLLTRGCDVWLNTPRRPMEASGTSGMKAAMNGTLHLSILDGRRVASTASLGGRSATSASARTRTRATSRPFTRHSSTTCCPPGPTLRPGPASCGRPYGWARSSSQRTAWFANTSTVSTPRRNP
jgi:glucan phosphorylase